ncbi:serine/threonine-protein kinase HAL4/sat4 [Actinomortierella wolfii]|nr:serine/threonine-protein kinase HAL4/sat4 [Actinomortierella wolfii]
MPVDHSSNHTALPKLYRRLLRLFKPPTDSSDSGDALPSALLPSAVDATSKGPTRGPFGFPANPFGENGPFSVRRRAPANNTRTAATKGMATTISRKSSHACQHATVVLDKTPPSASISQKHHPNGTLGLRARLMRKLASTPNLKAAAFALPSSPYPIVAGEGGKSINQHSVEARNTSNGGERNNVNNRQLEDQQYSQASKDAIALQQPLLTSFHHCETCPAGQRMLARAESRRYQQQLRPRAKTIPQFPAPTPTLQSKYGIPSRELGAGTQAQVMLLRVRSGKRLRDWLDTHTADSSTITPAPLLSCHSQSRSEPISNLENLLPMTPALLQPDSSTETQHNTLKPFEHSGTITTTTSEHMTQQQREAYRKSLSTKYGGFSQASNRCSFNSSTQQQHNGGTINGAMEGNQQQQQKHCDDLIFAIKRFRPPKTSESHRQYLKKICAEFCISTSMVHENVIRTIDLVRDQPGHDLEEEKKDAKYAEKHQQASMNQLLTRANKSKRQTAINSGNITDGEDESECDDCQCPNFDLYRQQRRHRRLHQKMEEEQFQAEVVRLKQEQQYQQQQSSRMFMKKAFSHDERKNRFPEYCMVMEFAAGGDMFSLLTKSESPITLNEKHCLWRQLINGVYYLHSMGVAHRDLKPENLLIDASGRILKISDFGIANVFKSVGNSAALPCRGILGSEPYIAPEEFYQDEYDPRLVDVWACGIILYVMYYSAMPWARADRKKDARFARYVNDIYSYRRSEPLRRQQYERYVAAKKAYDAASRQSKQRHHSQDSSMRENSYVYGSSAETLDRSIDSASADSINHSKCLQHASSIDDTSSEYIYNTYSYNQFLGGHEFIDRIEPPGCRRVLYAILEPDSRRRLTIDQVLQDEWVQQIRYCTDDPEKQEEQCAMHLNLTRDAKDMEMMKKQGRLADIYLRMPQGYLHHQHAIPKRIKV